MRFFEETTLSPEREKEINNWITKGGDLRRSRDYIESLLNEIDLLRIQKAKILEDVRFMLNVKK